MPPYLSTLAGPALYAARANETFRRTDPAWIGNSATPALHVLIGIERIAHPQMPLRAGHELHEPAGPGRRDGLGVESRFDLDDRHDQPGFDPMLPGIPFREPRPRPSGPTARISRSALKRPKN